MHKFLELVLSLVDRLVLFFSSDGFRQFFEKLSGKNGILYILALLCVVVILAFFLVGGEIIV